jgi:membrane protein
VASTAARTRAGVPDELQGLQNRLRSRGLWSTVREIVEVFAENGLIIFASAISFRILFGLIPFAMFFVALLGFLQLDEVWRQDVAPEVRERTSDAAFTLIDQTAERVLRTKEGFWLTAGGLLAYWEVSAAVRVTMRALDRIYRERRPRGLRERLALSLALALPIGACLLGALAAGQVLPRALDRVGGGQVGDVAGVLLGWGLGAVLVAVAVALMIRFGPSTPQPFRLAGAASIFVVVCWAVTSGLFVLYATQLAVYGSVFGGLAFAFVLFTYVFLSSIAFLAGLQVDAYLRRAAKSA